MIEELLNHVRGEIESLNSTLGDRYAHLDSEYRARCEGRCDAYEDIEKRLVAMAKEKI